MAIHILTRHTHKIDDFGTWIKEAPSFLLGKIKNVRCLETAHLAFAEILLIKVCYSILVP